jgi:hypothetical protein
MKHADSGVSDTQGKVRRKDQSPTARPEGRAPHALQETTGNVGPTLGFVRRRLILDVEEDGEIIRFRDRCNQSLVVYDGAWTILPRGGATELTYELTARPAFSVPAFVLRKLLRRDSQIMIERLRAEIRAREAAR